MLQFYGIDASDQRAAAVLQQYDTHRGGKLNLVEFARLVHDLEASPPSPRQMQRLHQPSVFFFSISRSAPTANAEHPRQV